MRAVARFLAASCLFVGVAASATATERGGWTLYWENDSLGRRDAHYTNGLRFVKIFDEGTEPDWTHRLRSHVSTSSWSRRLGLADCEVSGAAGCARYEFGWSTGQQMYTPEDIRRPRLLRTDRPYAGWLYLGRTIRIEGRRFVHEFEGNLGFVGPNSMAGAVQKGWHWVLQEAGVDVPSPKGWEHQLRAEPVVQTTAQTAWTALRFPAHRPILDLTPHAELALGTVQVYAGVGASVRLGFSLPSHQGAGTIRARAAFLDQGAARSHAYAFYRFDRRHVAYNKFLEGNLAYFGPSHSVPPIRDLSDREFGISLRFASGRGALAKLARFELQLAHVIRDREFVGQVRRQEYDSLALSVRR